MIVYGRGLSSMNRLLVIYIFSFIGMGLGMAVCDSIIAVIGDFFGGLMYCNRIIKAISSRKYSCVS